jgi:hypothetical protein
MLLGHLAVPLILRHYFKLDLVPLAAGTLVPDAVDKSLQITGAAPNGRTIAHTLLAVASSTLIVNLLYGRTTARSWLCGYLGHLICDLEGLIPWWYPFASYDFQPSTRNLWQKIKHGLYNTSMIEIWLLLWAIQIVSRK